MINFIKNNGILNWVGSQLCVDCDLISANVYPVAQVQPLPGFADFAYVIFKNEIYFIDKKQNIAHKTLISEQTATALIEKLKINLNPQEAFTLHEMNLSSEKLRTIHRIAKLNTPKTMMPLINTAIIISLFGFVPYAWLVYLPLFAGFCLYHYRSIVKNSIYFFKNFIVFMRRFSRRAGEWTGETLTLYPNRIIKFAASLAIFLMLGFNSWSLIAVYGVYRFADQEWVTFFKKGLSGIYNFTSGLFMKSLGKTSFYKRLGAGFGLAMLLATQSYLGGALSLFFMGSMIASTIAVGIGFKAFFRDLFYTLKNPIKVLLKSTGKILGALWGYHLAYRLFTGHVEGTLGSAVGHVESHGLFSGLFSSFLSPGGWFTTQTGMFGLLSARIQAFLNTVLTSVFVTTEMQTQGVFYGTVGPTLIQLFFFMTLGVLVGHLVEKAVNRFTNNVKTEATEQGLKHIHDIGVIYHKANQQGYISKWHMGYLTILTPMILASEGGATLVALAGGSLIGASVLTAMSLIGAYALIQFAGYTAKQFYFKFSSNKSTQLQQKTHVTSTTTPIQAVPAPAAITPTFDHQRKSMPTKKQTPTRELRKKRLLK